jgi:hypothetical protein
MLCALANTTSVSVQYATTSSQHVPFLPSAVFCAAQNHVFYKKVMIFFCQKWFTRLWVLQEIALAQDAIFVWGECSIPWRNVGLAIEFIQETELLLGLLKTRNLQNAFSMWHLSTLYQRSHQSDRCDSASDSFRSRTSHCRSHCFWCWTWIHQFHSSSPASRVQSQSESRHVRVRARGYALLELLLRILLNEI